MCARMKMLWATSSCLPVLAFIWLLSDQVFGGPAENSPVEMQSSADIPLVEISKELSEGESASIKERANVVSAWYTRQGIEVAPENVPSIAAMGSGGGCLAMISFLAILEELKNQDLLDAFMYTYGCSGSTWALTTLYDSGNWVENLEKVNAQFFAEIADPTLKPSLIEALSDLLNAGEREDFSMTDIWATAFVNPATKRHNHRNLSSWKAFQENGSVPYAVLAAVDKKAIERTNFTNPDIELEFTTHRVGYFSKGAYVVTTHYESKFNNKQLVERFREPDLSYFQALWGSAIASNQETLNLLTDFVAKIFKDPVQNGLVPLLDAVLLKKVFPPGTETPLNLAFVTNLNQALALVNSSIGTGASKQRLQDLINLMSGNESTSSSQLATLMAKYWDTSDNKSKTDAVKILSMTMAQEFTPKLVPVQSKEVTLLLKIVKCLGTWTWGTTNNFNYNITTIEPPKIYLMDSGVGMMTPFPLALRSPRNTDLMLNMDFWPLDPFNTVMRAANYCSANNISFPPLVIPEGDEFNPSQACYIFEGLNKPTVIHFPIFNQQNSGGAVKELTLQYIVSRNQYFKAEIDALIGYARANVRICASKIKEKILQLVKKR